MFKKSKIDPVKLFRSGVAEQIKLGDAAEKKKLGFLRGGSTGMINEQGEIIGTCANHAYLRMIGASVKPSEIKKRVDKQLMFSGGLMNEDHWLASLQTVYDPSRIKCEEEIGTRWETENGTLVTGRPDIVLLNDKLEPDHGLELKQIMSVNSGYNVLVKREPQLKHLMQATHYMWQLNCPFTIAYTCRNNLDMPGWMTFRPFPKPEDDHTGCIGYRYYYLGEVNNKTGKPKKHQITEGEYLDNKYPGRFAEASKITPFTLGFELKFDDYGAVWYKDTGEGEGVDQGWKKTIVDIDSIVRFFEHVSKLDPKKDSVSKEAHNLDVFGKKLGWKLSQYSDYQDLDPAFHQGLNLGRWIDRVKKRFG